MHIHHWIGEKSTPDKYGSAAIRAVELNTYLGGSCRIFREVESQESQTVCLHLHLFSSFDVDRFKRLTSDISL